MKKRAPTSGSGKHYHQMRDRAKANRIPNDKVFIKDSLFARTHLKARVINEKLIPYHCTECSIVDTWNGKPIVLHLDHINGDSFDNRLENLRFLCPNCHSQTETYSRGQTKKRKNDRRLELKKSEPAVV